MVIHSFQTYTVTDSGVDDYVFIKNFLITDHIKVYIKAVGTTTYVETTDFTTSGSEGALTITIGDTLTIGDIIRISRITPVSKDNQLVDFQAGSLTEDDLDISHLQNLYIAQEVIDDQSTDLINKDATLSYWDAETNKISNLVDPESAQDAATRAYVISQVSAAVVEASGMPPATGQDDSVVLMVTGDTWGYKQMVGYYDRALGKDWAEFAWADVVGGTTFLYPIGTGNEVGIPFSGDYSASNSADWTLQDSGKTLRYGGSASYNALFTYSITHRNLEDTRTLYVTLKPYHNETGMRYANCWESINYVTDQVTLSTVGRSFSAPIISGDQIQIRGSIWDVKDAYVSQTGNVVTAMIRVEELPG